MCVSQAIFASCIPEIIDLIGTRPKYGGTLKNEKGRRWEQSQNYNNKKQNKQKQKQQNQTSKATNNQTKPQQTKQNKTHT